MGLGSCYAGWVLNGNGINLFVPDWKFVLRVRSLALVALLLLLIWASAGTVPNGQSSALVKVTPLGSHADELCRNDRAPLFEFFAKALTDMIVPLSDVVRTFDGTGHCVGCR